MTLSHGRCTNPLFPNLWLAAHLVVFKNPQTSRRYKCRLDIQEETITELSKLQNHNCIYKKKKNEPHLWSIVDLSVFAGYDTELTLCRWHWSIPSFFLFFKLCDHVRACLSPKKMHFYPLLFKFLIETCVLVCFFFFFATLIQEKDNKTCFCLFCTSFPFVFHSWLVAFLPPVLPFCQFYYNRLDNLHKTLVK